MTIEQLTTVLHTQPFHPFRIHMTDGRSVNVAHPDFLSRSPAGRTVIVYKQDETFEIIDMLLVINIGSGPKTCIRPLRKSWPIYSR